MNMKRVLVVVFDIVIVTIFTPIFGRSIVLFSIPFIVSLLLLIRLTSRTTIYAGILLCLIVGLLWVVSYTSKGAGVLSLVPFFVTLVVGMAGVFLAIFIDRFIR